MKKIISLCLLCISVSGFSQVNINTSENSNKWRFGGGIGLGFGNNSYFGFNISPFLGYEIIPSLEVGATVGYQYSKWADTKQNLFSGGPYMNYYPIQSLFLRTHYEYFSGKNYYDNFDGGETAFNYDEHALWLGGGYRSPGKVQFFTGLMYNVLYKKESSIFSSGLRPLVGISINL